MTEIKASEKNVDKEKQFHKSEPFTVRAPTTMPCDSSVTSTDSSNDVNLLQTLVMPLLGIAIPEVLAK